MYAKVVFVICCLYTIVSLTLVREYRFLSYYYNKCNGVTRIMREEEKNEEKVIKAGK